MGEAAIDSIRKAAVAGTGCDSLRAVPVMRGRFPNVLERLVLTGNIMERDDATDEIRMR